VFVDKRFLDRNPIFPKSWQTTVNLQFMSIPTPETGLQFYCWLHKCILNASACVQSWIYGDNLGQMNHKISEELANSQLLPYLPQNKVVITGNVLYHCMQGNTLSGRYPIVQCFLKWCSTEPWGSIRKVYYNLKIITK
jgi:hypothetical protein